MADEKIDKVTNWVSTQTLAHKVNEIITEFGIVAAEVEDITDYLVTEDYDATVIARVSALELAMGDIKTVLTLINGE